MQCHELRQFGLKYILSAEDDAILIINCPDINDHLSKLSQEKVISEYFESIKISFSNRFSITIDYLKYTKGATFVSIGESMIFQDDIKNRQIRVLLDHR